MPKDALRKSHVGILLNDKSGKMEERLRAALEELVTQLQTAHQINIEVEKRLYLPELVAQLNAMYQQAYGVEFKKATTKTNIFLTPDGGFLYIRDAAGNKRCILVIEAKRQGTNNDRLAEGKKKQAQGNAIERLRKNMQGIDCFFSGEAITPFVCFGEGWDFQDESSILDRVSTMNSFFPLNTVHVDKLYLGNPVQEIFKPASLFFREESWSPAEMLEVMQRVSERAIAYYQAKYGILHSAQITPAESKPLEVGSVDDDLPDEDLE